MTVTPLRKRSDPIIGKERITPNQARQMLQNMDHRQRPVAPSRVAKYARDMKDGKWLDSGETIKFNNGGQLIDGQHRLMAIVESGIAVDLLVARGVPDEAFLVIDTGKTRGWGDALAIDGVPAPICKAVATAAGLAIGYKAGQPGEAARVSNADVVEYVRKNPDIVSAVQFVDGIRETGMLMSVAQLAWVSYETRRIDPTESDLFIMDIISGSQLAPTDPVLALRTSLMQDRMARKRLPTVQLLGGAVKAWNKRRKGQKMGNANTLTRRDWSNFPRFE